MPGPKTTKPEVVLQSDGKPAPGQCHNTATRLQLFTPLAAYAPVDSSKTVVLSPLTTLATVGGLNTSTILSGLGLPANVDIESFDALASFTQNSKGMGREVYRAEVEVMNMAGLGASLFFKPTLENNATADAPTYAQLSQGVLQVVSGLFDASPLKTSGLAGSRRRLLATSRVDLTNATTVQKVLAGTKTLAATGQPGTANEVSQPALVAAAAGVANINKLTSEATTTQDAQRAAVVAQSQVSQHMADMGSGAITPTQFQQLTTTTALKSNMNNVKLTGAKKKHKLSGGQKAGIVIGTLVGAALLVAIGTFLFRSR